MKNFLLMKGLLTMILFTLVLVASPGNLYAQPPLWKVQSDYFGERNAIAQPRTIRGMALSEDGTSVFTGLIQSPNTGSTSLRKVKSNVLAVAGTDHVIFGNGMPGGGCCGFNQVGGQPVYAGGGTGTFEGWRDVDNSPEGIDTDDRGYVYVALQSGIAGANRVEIYSSNLATLLGTIFVTAPTGVHIYKSGAIYYAYVMSSGGLQRWNVTTVGTPVLDVSYSPGVMGRGLTIDTDGTVFTVGTGSGQVNRISPAGSVTHTTTVTNAAGVAVYGNKIYIIKRQSPTQPIVVLNKADLTSGGPDIVVPALGATRGDISQFTSIDVNQYGQLYVSEENYGGAVSGSNSGALTSYVPPATSFNPVPGPITGRIYFDRVLVSTPVIPPVHNLTQNTFYLTIQDAVNAANPNDVLECAEWTFNERVTVDKSLTIQGVNNLTSIVDGSGLAGNGSGFYINAGVTNVTIKNLTIKNFAGVSPNSYAGIYAVAGNNNLNILNNIIRDNVGGSGFYANGPINGVTIDGNKVSGHTNAFGAARGIVIWNGLKQNITITNNEVFNNNCCGIELQDGSGTNVFVGSNNVHDNGDNGIGIVGLTGPGANMISSNSLTNNGRFGIEIKNADGNGNNGGAGSIVVFGNTVARTVPATDMRDLAGIAVFRRGVLPGNVDVPRGVYVNSNAVSGYTQASTSEGFGIVMEGMNHTVTGNNVTGNDVGIQRQAGHLPYPGDGNQNDMPDMYFGRGNSPVTCGVNVSGNTLSNTINTRDVGNASGMGIVTNLNTGESFCSIQAAINDAQTLPGHTISASSGNYNEDVVINKQLTLIGAGYATTTVSGPIGGGGSTMQVAASGVIVEGFTITRDGNNTTDWNNPGLNSAGVSIQGLALSGTMIRKNRFTGMRTAIDINNSNGHSITDNIITFNRTGLIFRNQTDNMTVTGNEITDNWTVGVLFLDASGGTNVPVQSALNGAFNNNNISGNWYGEIVDRQSGGVLPAPGTTNRKQFTCNWYGTVTPVVTTANSTEPGYAAQIPVAYGGTATDPGGQPDIAGPASANFVYMPFLINGTDNDPAMGFQPVPNSCSGCQSGNTIQNTNTGEFFCTIQAAVDDAQTVNGHTISVSSGNYDEQVKINKSLTIQGVGLTQPMVNYTGTVSGKPTLFDISADAVTIDNIHFNVDLSKLKSAIIASGVGIDNIVIQNNVIDAYGVPSAGTYGDRNAVSINYGGNTNYRVASGGVNNILYQNNIVNGTIPTSFFRAAIATDESGGTFTGNTSQTINHDLISRFGSNGNINVTNNTCNGGGIELADMNAGAGTITVTGNSFNAAFANVAAAGTAVLRLKDNYNSKTTIVDGNTFINHEWAISQENYNSVTVSNNVFTPNPGSTSFHHITVNTKAIVSQSNLVVQVTNSADIRNNIFNGSGSAGGSAVSFLNHDNRVGTSFGAFNVNENSFDATIANDIQQDNQAGPSNTATFPNYNLLIGGGPATITMMAPWTAPIEGTCNWYGTTNNATISTKVGPDVNYQPYLTDGTDNSGDIGFQPVPGSCTGAPLPILTATVNTVTLTADNNGSEEEGEFVVCNTAADNMFFSGFMDLNNSTPAAKVKVIQMFTPNNVTVCCPNGIFPLSAYAGSFSRNVSLINPSMSGTLLMKFRAFFDTDNDNVADPGEPMGDWLQYLVKVDGEAPQLTGTLPGGDMGSVCMSAAPTAPSTATIAAQYTDWSNIIVTQTGSEVSGDDCGWSAIYTYSVTDACGNAAPDAVVEYTGADVTPPTFTRPADVTLYKDAACAVNESPGGAAGDVNNESDNCSVGLNATYSDAVTNNCPGSYTITRTWSLVDNCGNPAANQVQTIMVLDRIAPVLSIPADAAAECSAVPAPGAASATDNCDASPTVTYLGESVTPSQVYTAYNGTRTNGNQNYGERLGMIFNAANSFTVTELGAYDDGQNGLNLPITVGIVRESDGATMVGPVTMSGISDPLRGYYRVRSVAPVTLPAGDYIIVAVGYGNGELNGNSNNGGPAAMFNSGGGLLTSLSSPYGGAGFGKPTTAFPTPNIFHAGTFNFHAAAPTACANNYTLTRTWKAEDGCGNSSVASQTITVSDNTAPVITPGSIASCYPTAADAEAAAIAATNANDNCAGTVTKTASTTGTCSAIVTVTATDACGNPSSTSYNTRIDNTPPTITCPGNQNRVTDAGQCYYTAMPGEFNPVLYADNCGSVTISNNVNNTNSLDGEQFPIGSTTVTWTATDPCGNQSTCTFDVAVGDDQNSTSYIIYAKKEVKFGEDNDINGDVGVTDANGKAEFKKGCTLDPHHVYAKNITVQMPAMVSHKHYQAATNGPDPTFQSHVANPLSGNHTQSTNGIVPLGNFKNLTIKKNVTATVNGSDYGKITIEEGANVTFTAGTINLEELSVGKGKKGVNTTNVYFDGPASVSVKDRVTIEEDCRINVGGPKVTFYLGDAKKDEENFRVKGDNTQVTLNIMIPNGKLKIDKKSDNCIMTGWFIIEKLESTGMTTWNRYDCSLPAAFAAPGSTIITTEQAPVETVVVAEKPAEKAAPFAVRVYPNPSTVNFSIVVNSQSLAPVTVRVMDMSGNVLSVMNNALKGSVIRLGGELRAGTYMAEVTQGSNRQVVKLVKIN